MIPVVSVIRDEHRALADVETDHEGALEAFVARAREFRQLFRCIVNLTPAPMGLGPPARR